jgi:hypothetical protein
LKRWQSQQSEGEAPVSEQPVELLGDAIEATRQAKQELDEALWRLAAIETDYNREAKQPGVDLGQLAIERAAAEDGLGIQRLIERRHDAQRWAGLVDDSVRVCRRYSFERVIVAQIRRLLQQHAGPDEDLELFAMTLLRHVRVPEDPALYEAVRAVFHRIREHKPIPVASD